MSDPYFTRPNPPPVPPAEQNEPLQLEPTLNEDSASRFRTITALIGGVLVLILVLFALTRQDPEQQTGSQVAATPPAAPADTGPGTTGRGSQTPQPGAANPATVTPGQPRIDPQEQDPIEQNTRP